MSSMLDKELLKQFEEARSKLMEVSSLEVAEALRVALFGKKGLITRALSSLKNVDKEQRRSLGREMNRWKEELHDLWSRRRDEVLSSTEDLRASKVDLTLPGSPKRVGRRHPLSSFMDFLVNAAETLGFSVALGPDIEQDFFNFEALNFPHDHPSRAMHDTFHLKQGHLLRTHTSNVQVRWMQQHQPPFRIVAPGRVYRNEDISARSHVVFHQMEGFYVDRGVTIPDLLSTVEELLKRLFRRAVGVRFRPSYFPFVEPGIEVDVECLLCQQERAKVETGSEANCRLCKGTGWLEVLGAGMIHPRVLEAAGVNFKEFQGFAWGVGVERLLMLMDGIPDIRIFLENDERYLQQYHACRF